jgi:hypothetical protein
VSDVPALVTRLEDPREHVVACHYPVGDNEVLASAVPSVALAAPEELAEGGAA